MTHKEALRKIDNELERVEDNFPNFLNCIKKEMRTVAEALTKHEELVGDVQRYFELDRNKFYNSVNVDEFLELHDKLSKVEK